MKKEPNIYLAFATLIISITIFIGSLYNFELAKVSNNNSLKEVEIKQGSITSVANLLKEKNLIKNVFVFKLYTYISGKTNLKAATYKLSENMGTKKIVDILNSDKGTSNDNINITFKEGRNIRDIANVIEENTNNSKDAVFNLLDDKDYLNELINNYWFIDNNILDSRIYYPLEGYLYPNTYSFSNKDVTIKEIFKSMLDEMDKQLSKYKSNIENNGRSIHELITLASIVELEGSTLEDRKIIAGVFYNRLKTGMSLGSDVTTYYGAKINMADRDLYAKEVSECNNYNTRCATFKTIPVSPICNPSIESIEAVLNYENSDYYYFVADKNKKVYFSKTASEHNQTIYKLKSNNLWYQY